MAEDTIRLDEVVEIEGSQLTLETLLSFNLGDVKEVRTFRLPVGSYLFEGEKPVIRVAEIDEEDKATGINVKKKIPVIVIPSKVIHIFGMTFKDPEDSKTEEEVLGKKFYQTFFIRKGEDLGRIKAHFIDVGIQPAASSLQQLLETYEGHKWVGRIIHTTNKNDPDRPFVNLKDGSVKPATPEQLAVAAPIPNEAA